jgi:integrase
VENLSTGDHDRVRKRVQSIAKRYKSKREAELHIDKIIYDINCKLAKGIHPFYDRSEMKSYSSFTEVFDKFLSEKEREIRPETYRVYTFYISRFKAFLNKNINLSFINNYEKKEAIRYMDYVYNEKKISQRTYNNYLKFMRLFFNWLIEKDYISKNSFNDIKTKKREPKKRILIDKKNRDIITKHLENNNQPFLAICKLVYSSLLRPKEILSIKISNIKLEDEIIVIPAEVSKNKKTRTVSLTIDLINYFKSMNLKQLNANYYVFGDNLLPAKKSATARRLDKEWYKMRTRLGFPKEMQLYSLRDTGITDMLKSGIDPLSVKQHADHHSLEMTTIYSNHIDPNLANIIREKAPNF